MNSSNHVEVCPTRICLAGAVNHTWSIEVPRLSRRGKAAATEGLFFIISLELLKLLSTPQSSSLCSADSSPRQWEPMCFVVLVVCESCGCWVLLLQIVANQA
ncbi:MAG: hypothetical protein J5890_04880 [Clostridia bacterium]|nr:hypothetical protein [Clostridia bacterium]